VLVKDAVKHANDQAAFKRELVQAWQARQRCTDAACVKTWYERRIAEVAGAPAPIAVHAPRMVPEPRAQAVSAGTLQALGRKLGFDIAANRSDFNARFGSLGGQCGAGKFRPLKEMYSTSAVAECWIMAPCPSPSQDMKCGVVRTGFDAKNRAVIFMTQLQAVSADAKTSREVIDTLVRVFNALGGKTPRAQQAEPNSRIESTGTDGGLTYQAMVVTPPAGHPFVIVSIMER